MLTMKPHGGETSQKTWDIVDDVFDLGLLGFALFWEFTGVHFDEGLLTKIAISGASLRIAARRVFRAVLGPRITAWVKREQTKYDG